MNEFTEGEWRAEQYGSNGIWRVETDGWNIADMWPMNGRSKMAEANAKLIAAAPNLARACLRLLEAYRRGEAHGGSIDWEDVDEAWMDASNAIQKAGIEFPEAEEEGKNER